MGPQAAHAKITSEMTLSEKADAIEEHMMHELDKIVTKSVFANMTDGQVEMEGGAALRRNIPASISTWARTRGCRRCRRSRPC